MRTGEQMKQRFYCNDQQWSRCTSRQVVVLPHTERVTTLSLQLVFIAPSEKKSSTEATELKVNKSTFRAQCGTGIIMRHRCVPTSNRLKSFLSPFHEERTRSFLWEINFVAKLVLSLFHFRFSYAWALRFQKPFNKPHEARLVRFGEGMIRHHTFNSWMNGGSSIETKKM